VCPVVVLIESGAVHVGGGMVNMYGGCGAGGGLPLEAEATMVVVVLQRIST